MSVPGPDISVIMPCYNSEQFIERSLSSVWAQTFEDFEIIIVNDGSTDTTAEILGAVTDPRAKVINQPNLGVSAARNTGISESSGKYISFLDADDSWSPYFLATMINTLRKHPEAGLAYCGWQNIGVKGPRAKPFIPPDYENNEKLKSLLTTCPWPIHAVTVLKSAIVGHKGFDTALTNAEDYKLWLEIAGHYPIVRVPEVFAYYYFHQEGQASQNAAVAAISHLKVKRDFIRRRPELVKKLGAEFIQKVTYGQLVEKAYDCYWARDVVNARQLFQAAIKSGCVKFADLKYLLPCLLPLCVHKKLIRLADAHEGPKP